MVLVADTLLFIIILVTVIFFEAILDPCKTNFSCSVKCNKIIFYFIIFWFLNTVYLTDEFGILLSANGNLFFFCLAITILFYYSSESVQLILNF